MKLIIPKKLSLPVLCTLIVEGPDFRTLCEALLHLVIEVFEVSLTLALVQGYWKSYLHMSLYIHEPRHSNRIKNSSELPGQPSSFQIGFGYSGKSA